MDFQNQGVYGEATSFTLGLASKVLLADTYANYLTSITDLPLEFIGIAEGLNAGFLFGLQIYFDFAGYSLMAIGLGYCFGLRVSSKF